MIDRTEIAFIDPNVSDIDTLIAGSRPDVDWVRLDGSEPAPRQIARALDGRNGLAAIHVIAHGAPGEVSFGAGTLSLDSIDEQAADLGALGTALGERGALMLWSCQTGQGERGSAFIKALARASGAKVAAATGLVGAAARGGSWDLTARSGGDAARPPLTAAGIGNYAGVMKAVIKWVGTTSAAWGTATNWDSGTVPTSADAVEIATSSNAPILSSSTTIASLKIDTGMTLTLSGSSTKLNAGTTSLVGTGSIIGVGTLQSSVTTSGGNVAATITASGGTLDVTGTITGAHIVLATGTGGSDWLKLDGAGSTAASMTFGGTSGTLEIGLGGGLTLTSALTVGSNTVKLDSATSTLTDAAGVTLGTGAITGLGTVTAAVTATGAANITANGGTLHVTGAVIDGGGALVLAVTGASDRLLLDAGSAAHTVNLNGGTLELGTTGTLTVGTALAIGAGTVQLDGASTLTDASGVTLAGGTISGTGGLAANTDLTGYGTVGIPLSTAGTITASSGTLDFTNAVNGSGSALNFHIANVAGSVLRFDGPVGTSSIHPTIAFDAAGGGVGELDLTHISLAGFNGIIANFGNGEGIKIAGANHDSLDGTGTILTVFDSSNVSLGTINFATSQTGTNFHLGANGDIVTCFMPGTRVLTPAGEVNVETLKIGDLVTTSDGAAAPVKWIGRQTVSRVFADPLSVLPIRIRQGALGEAVPSRDLLLSPDHAILLDGVLVQARALVNGTSILRETDVPATFTYYHVELDDHSLILAENVPAETFVDNIDRLRFDNWDEHQALYPDGKGIAEMQYARAQSFRQVPPATRQRLAGRGAALYGQDAASAA
jgi:hypothetical protein